MATGIGVFTLVLVVVLWWWGTAGLTGQALVTARFDALRTGLGVGAGSGGAFALYLAWRRQHATEVSLVQKEHDQAAVDRAFELQRDVAEDSRVRAEQVARDTREDAAARRVTELYAKSVEQLGSEKTAVRLGGLYALERLAQDNPHQRQAVVGMMCSYLRMMPFTPPEEPLPDADDRARAVFEERVQEREVRVTAQRILATHLRPGAGGPHDPVETFWPDTDIDLTGAVLTDFDFSDCRPRRAEFRRARFGGETLFRGATFDGAVRFDRTRFLGFARFDKATFAELADFGRARFGGNTWFANTTFEEETWFDDVTFAGTAVFNGATFAEEIEFTRVKFRGDLRFRNVKCNGTVRFNEVTFAAAVHFPKAGLPGGGEFEDALVAHPVPRTCIWPTGWEPADEHVPVDDGEGTWHHIVAVDRDPAPDTTERPGDSAP
ncbi:pentapeptide repeat-containing protein [Actinosynnema sp. CA-299493]